MGWEWVGEDVGLDGTKPNRVSQAYLLRIPSFSCSLCMGKSINCIYSSNRVKCFTCPPDLLGSL